MRRSCPREKKMKYLPSKIIPYMYEWVYRLLILLPLLSHLIFTGMVRWLVEGGGDWSGRPQRAMKHASNKISEVGKNGTSTQTQCLTLSSSQILPAPLSEALKTIGMSMNMCACAYVWRGISRKPSEVPAGAANSGKARGSEIVSLRTGEAGISASTEQSWH